jgi:hypothetical protein
MPTRAPTATTIGVIDGGYSTGSADTVYQVPQSEQVAIQNRYVQFAARRAFGNWVDAAALKLDPTYVLNIAPVAPWLASVERRINDSIIPKEYERKDSTEWLREEVGNAATLFFQNAADVLPGEPFLYASKTGALVAEFAAPNGTLTAVISSSAITLFAVRADRRDLPVEVTVRRGSIGLRKDLKPVLQSLAGSHGPMGTAR